MLYSQTKTRFVLTNKNMEGLILTDEMNTMSKAEIISAAQSFVSHIAESGDVNPLEMYIKIKRFDLLVSSVVENLKSLAKKEAEKYGKSFSLLGANCTITNGRTLLDYDSDGVYSSLSKKLNDRKKFLELAYKSSDVIFDSEGVEVPKVKIKSDTKDSLTINL